MKVELPKFLEPDLLNIENLSFCQYIQKEPQVKNSVYLQKNLLIFVKKGTKILHLEDKTIEVDTDSILFLRNGHYIMTEVLEEYYEAMLFLYEDELLIDFIKKYNIKFDRDTINKSTLCKITSSNELKNLIDTTCNYFLNFTKNKEDLIKLKLEEAFLNILNSSKKEDFLLFLSSVYTNNYFKIEIEKNFSYEDNILELATYFKMSEAKFRQRFKEVFETTPKKWQNYKRLEKAKILLENSDKNVSEICIESGFDNLSWFIQNFKKTYKKTPKQIKNNKN